jgi:hypothetical protein
VPQAQRRFADLLAGRNPSLLEEGDSE